MLALGFSLMRMTKYVHFNFVFRLGIISNDRILESKSRCLQTGIQRLILRAVQSKHFPMDPVAVQMECNDVQNSKEN